MKVVITEGVGIDRIGTIVGPMPRPVDGCDTWVRIEGITNPVGYDKADLIPVKTIQEYRMAHPKCCEASELCKS
jgi:hypothetical protein